MARIRKAYFTLGELAGEWGLPEADLRYVAENGLLQFSVRVVTFRRTPRDHPLDREVFGVG